MGAQVVVGQGRTGGQSRQVSHLGTSGHTSTGHGVAVAHGGTSGHGVEIGHGSASLHGAVVGHVTIGGHSGHLRAGGHFGHSWMGGQQSSQDTSTHSEQAGQHESHSTTEQVGQLIVVVVVAEVVVVTISGSRAQVLDILRSIPAKAL